MNDTLRLFSEFAWRTQVRQMNGDPAWREADRQYEACQRDFEARHAHNRALVREVNALLDARAGVAGVETDFGFLLGLQMGLELGALRILDRE